MFFGQPKSSVADVTQVNIAATDPHYNPIAASVPQAKSLDSGMRWLKKDPNNTDPYIITYSFPDEEGNERAYTTDGDSVTVHYKPLTSLQRAEFIRVTHEFEKVANITFVEFHKGIQTNVKLPDNTMPMIRIRAANIEETISAVGSSSFPYRENNGIVIELDPSWIDGNPASFSCESQLHELGHAMGLKHPFQKGDTPQTDMMLPAVLDTVNETVMSYSSSDPDSVGGKITLDVPGSRCDPSTLGPLDIAELQNFYGANWNYSVVPENGPIKLTGEQKVWTVWNGRYPGIFDATAYKGKEDVKLNLNPGGANPSKIGQEYVFIAYGTIIHRAIGAPNASNRFIGNVNGGSICEGGKGNNIYELSGKDNLIIAGKGHNVYSLRINSESIIRGFSGKDSIVIDETGNIQAIAHRDGKNVIVAICCNDEVMQQVTLEGYVGPIPTIAIKKLSPSSQEALVPLENMAISDSAAKIVANHTRVIMSVSKNTLQR